MGDGGDQGWERVGGEGVLFVKGFVECYVEGELIVVCVGGVVCVLFWCYIGGGFYYCFGMGEVGEEFGGG